MPDTKDVKSIHLQNMGVHYWHWVRYPWFAGHHLLDPFHEPHWTTEIEEPYRHGIGRSVRLFGPLGIAWGRWVTAEEQARYIPPERENVMDRSVSRFRRMQSSRAIRGQRGGRNATVIEAIPEFNEYVKLSERESLLHDPDVPLEHL